MLRAISRQERAMRSSYGNEHFYLKKKRRGWLERELAREGLQMLGDFFPPSGTGEAAAYSESGVLWSDI